MTEILWAEPGSDGVSKPPKNNFKRRIDGAIRRLMDIGLSASGLVVLAPLFIVIALKIKRDSDGPVFYWGPRAGQFGTSFSILKFRTMFESIESYRGPPITAQGDSRITPFGAWLRATKINELPQLWNVLKGDMSLVGPRPEDLDLVSSWPDEVREMLLSVRPGITSPASIAYRDEEAMLTSANILDEYLREILPTKLRLDYLYVRDRNFLNDLDIILWTFIVLIPSRRVQQISEQRLRRGPLTVFIYRYFNWFAADLIIATLAVSITGIIWRSSGPLHIGQAASILIAISMALLFSVLNSILGINRIYWSKAQVSEIIDLAVSTGVVTLVVLIGNSLVMPVSLPYGMVLVSGLLAFLGFGAARYRGRIFTGLARRWLSRRGTLDRLGERVLIVGAGELGQIVLWLLRKGELAQALTPVGWVDDNPKIQDMQIDGVRVLGSTADLSEIVKKRDIGVIIFAISRISADERGRIYQHCMDTGVRVVLIPNIMDTLRESFLGDWSALIGTSTRVDTQRKVNGSHPDDAVHTLIDQLETAISQQDQALISKLLGDLRGRAAHLEQQE